jgi:hypothetical protein
VARRSGRERRAGAEPLSPLIIAQVDQRTGRDVGVSRGILARPRGYLLRTGMREAHLAISRATRRAATRSAFMRAWGIRS